MTVLKNNMAIALEIQHRVPVGFRILVETANPNRIPEPSVHAYGRLHLLCSLFTGRENCPSSMLPWRRHIVVPLCMARLTELASDRLAGVWTGITWGRPQQKTLRCIHRTRCVRVRRHPDGRRSPHAFNNTQQESCFVTECPLISINSNGIQQSNN